MSLIAILTVAGLWSLSWFDLVRFIEAYANGLKQASYDSRTGGYEQWAREHIVILALSDEAFNDANPLRLPAAGTPVPRTFHAKIIDDLTKAGAKVIAFDFLFAAKRPQDSEFAAAARRSGKVVWACRFNEEDSTTSPGLTVPVPQLMEASPHMGHINAPKDAEQSSVTLMPVVKSFQGKPIPALSVVAAQTYLGLENQPLQKTQKGWRCGNLLIPVNDQDQFKIKYLGSKPGDIFVTWPYERAYSGFLNWDYYKAHSNEPLVSLRDKIVLVGDTTTLGHDVILTPLGEMVGVEVHAHAIATVLRNSFIMPVPEKVDFLVLCAVTALVCGIAANLRAVWAALASVAFFFSYVVFNIWLFFEHGIVLGMVLPCAAIIVATTAGVTERNLSVERAANHARALLQRYVSPQIANYILAHPEKAALGGTRVTASVLFSDIRGFTAMSEKLTPEEVLARLNEYLQEMTDVVFQHDGAVDKYIGDAVMALFGVPLVSDDHALKAVTTAIGMQEALLKLQDRWRAEGLPLIDIGIGINTGELVFGNMGANERRDFSVLGDTVNLASRVESLNKDMGSRILITAATYEIVRDKVRVRGPLTTHVKGKEEDVVVYEVFGWQEDSINEKHPERELMGSSLVDNKKPGVTLQETQPV